MEIAILMMESTIFWQLRERFLLQMRIILFIGNGGGLVKCQARKEKMAKGDFRYAESEKRFVIDKKNYKRRNSIMMKVELNIESSQLGETVIDLFKNLTPEEKQNVASQVLKEWLKEPSLFETCNYEQQLIEDFRTGKIKSSSYNTKYDKDTSIQAIRDDYEFKKRVENYRTSKQGLIESTKFEILDYYKKSIAEEIKKDEMVNKIKEETYKQLVLEFPKIITQVLVLVFANNLSTVQYQIQDSFNKSVMAESMIGAIMNKFK